MKRLEGELDANQEAFHADWTGQAQKNWAQLQKLAYFKESYRRISCFGAIKNDLLVPRYTAESVAFLHEAHNDSLISHVSAATGAWRSALQALRSCIENVMCAIYYRDHPVELALWSAGQYRIGFSELKTYLSKHPALSPLPVQLTGLDVLDAEYSTLSKAVHASAAGFRMTDAASAILLWDAAVAKAGQWSTRERHVLEGLSLLLVCLHRNDLQGTKLTPVRTMLYFTIGANKRATVKKELQVSIPEP